MFAIHSFIFCSLIILATTSSSAQEFPEFQKESGLGMVDYRAVTEAVKSSSKKSNRKKRYTRWSNKERFTIGKYAAENGHAATAQKFSSKEKPLNESTVRRFSKRYKDELQKSTQEKREMEKELSLLPRGRPLMLGSLDEMVQKYIPAYRSRGGPANSIIPISIAKVLIARNPQFNLEHIDLGEIIFSLSQFQTT